MLRTLVQTTTLLSCAAGLAGAAATYEQLTEDVAALTGTSFTGFKATWFNISEQPNSCHANGYAGLAVVSLPAPANAANATSYCGASVNVTNLDTGKSVLALVVDECDGCEATYLNLSPEAFADVSTLDTGVFNAVFEFVAKGEAADDDSDDDDNDDDAKASATAVASSATAAASSASATTTTRANRHKQAGHGSSSTVKTSFATSYVVKAASSSSTPVYSLSSSSSWTQRAASSSSTAALWSSSSQWVQAAQKEVSSSSAAYTPSTTWTPSSSSKKEYTPSSTWSSAQYTPSSTWSSTYAAATTSSSSSSSGSSSSSNSGQGTYFYQNGVAGACGTVHSDSDYIVALDSAIYASGAYCGKSLTIYNSANGNKVTATVADECPTCESAYSIDLSEGLFKALSDNDLDLGVLSITWWFD